MQPAVAVLLATFNGGRFLREQVESILNQGGVATTIFVRDDGSTDDTLNLISSYAAAYPSRIVLLAPAQRRFGAACENFLSILEDVVGKEFSYFAFSDQDDVWSPNKLRRALECLIATEASGYASNLTAFNALEDREWVIEKSQPQRRFDYLFQSASAGCTYVFDAAAAALIASCVAPVERHDWSGMSHDWLVYAICRSHGLSWVIDDRSCIRYRQHAQNQFGALPGPAGVLKRLQLIRDGWYRGVVLRNRPFLDVSNSDEQAILDRLTRLNLRDRLWLATHTHMFRRERKARLALAAALLTGIF